MTTFTLRVSDSLAARVNSAQMRDWLDVFLRQPLPLPHDPGPGYERVSLTLTENSVHAAAAYLKCPISSALRRIAIERLGAPRPPAAPVPRFLSPGMPTTVSTSKQADRDRIPDSDGLEAIPQNSTFNGEEMAGALIRFLLCVLFLGGWYLLNSHKKDGKAA